MEHLLQHASWIQSLARSLVRDSHEADDLVQETWVAAMHRQPDGAPRPWLATILKNVLRQRRRSEARRERRERASASDEALPSPDELVVQMECQRTLAALVLELDDPYRSVMILRYYHELSAAEIGRRRGIPADRVRWQLMRGRELLRDELERREGEGWRAWCSALIPLASRSTVDLSIGALLMSAKVLFPVTAAALVALVLLGFWPDSADPSVAVIGKTDPGAKSAANLELRPSAFLSAMRDRQPLAAESPSDAVELRGQVVDAVTGEGVGGAKIVLLEHMMSVTDSAQASTDAAGFFTLAELPPRSYALICCSPGRSPHIRVDLKVTTETVDALRIELHRGTSQTIEVVDETGSPIIGADVTLVGGTTKALRFTVNRGLKLSSRVVATDALGAAVIPGVLPGTQQVIVRAAGYASWVGEYRTTNRETRFKVTMLRGGALHGTVTRDDGLPIAGTTVLLVYRQKVKGLNNAVYRTDRATVDADGRYRIECLPAGPHNVAAFAKDGSATIVGSRSQPAAIIANGDENELDIRIPVPASVRGTLRGPGGEPVADASITVSSSDFMSTAVGFFGPRHCRVKVRSAADGSFVIPVLRSNTWRPLTLWIRHAAYRKAEQEIRPRAGRELVVDIELAAVSSVVAGRLTTESGDPVADLTVFAWDMQTGKLGTMFMAKTDTEGRYSIAVPPGLEALRVIPKCDRDSDVWKSTPRRVDHTISGTTGIDFVLSPRIFVRGSVSDQHGNPVRDFEVFAAIDGAEGYTLLGEVNSRDGRFSVPFEPNAHHHLVIAAQAFTPARISQPRVGVDHTVRLETPPDLRGRLIDGDGKPIAGVWLCLATLDSTAFPTRSVYTPRARSDAKGGFVLRGVPLREGLSLLICPVRKDLPMMLRHTLPADRDQLLSIEIPRAELVTVEFDDATGRPASGTVIVINKDGWPLNPRVEKALNEKLKAESETIGRLVGGRCQLRLSAGEYTLMHFALGDDRNASLHSLVVTGENTHLRFRLR